MNHPVAKISTEYIMTLHCPLDAPQSVSGDLLIFNVRAGGWAKGPAIKGEVTAPSADWLRVMPGGARKIDVRLSIRTEDGAHIFVSYSGRSRGDAEIARRLDAGETLGPDDLYFVTAPIFETAAPAYAWLNDIVAVGKMVSLNRSRDRHVTYDIFALK